MVTTRSLYTYKQFFQVFQAIAHEMAIDAVTHLKGGELVVKGYRPGILSEVKVGATHIKFYAKHLSFERGKYDQPDHMSFEIEEKFYSTSQHSTKISFYSPEIKNEDIEVKRKYGFMEHPVDHEKTDAEKKRRQKRINDFLEELMKDADIEPVPRFNLAMVQQA